MSPDRDSPESNPWPRRYISMIIIAVAGYMTFMELLALLHVH